MPQKQTSKKTTSPAPANNSPPPETPVEFEVTTLAELGNQLPVGIPIGSGLSKTFRLRRYRTKEEIAIAEMRKKKKSIKIGAFTTEVVAMMAQTIGPHDMDALKENERRALVQQMTAADVLYMYVYLRHEALGDEPITMEILCPLCSHQFPFYADIGTLKIRTVPSKTIDVRRVYDLRDGLPLQGEDRKSVWLTPLVWGDALANDLITAASEVGIVQASICGVEGIDRHPFAMTREEMYELTKYDLEGLVEDIEINTPGPQLAIEADCPSCGSQIARTLDWGWDSFFSRRSRRRAGAN